MKNWLKENLVLAIGLTLPLLLILLFFVASVLPKSLGQPPQYEMLFTTTKYEFDKDSDYVLDFKVKDNKLFVSTDNHNGSNVKLIAYNGKTESVREISLDMSKIVTAPWNKKFVLDETKDLMIDDNVVSPDGFRLEDPNYNDSGLMGGLFGLGNSRNEHRIKKGAVGYKIPNLPSENYYIDMHFVGWVINNDIVKK